VDLENAGDGGGGQAKDTENASQLIEISGRITGFDQAASEDADKGNLLYKAFKVGGFDTGEVTLFEATGVEAMFEGISVAKGGTTVMGIGGRGHRCGRWAMSGEQFVISY
jgi:hypothetical protein